jgi:chaperonin GroEL (HSP60 family)
VIYCFCEGREGVITVEAKGTETYVDVVEGMQFDRDIFPLIL